jgi:lipoprotein-releasing system ATP-binding protein
LRYDVKLEVCILTLLFCCSTFCDVQETFMPIVLSMHNVGRLFEGPGGSIRILEDINLELHSGDAVAIRGPSGCGKSTLLLLAGTLDTPSSGVLEVLGKNPWTLAAPKLARFRNQHIGFVFQEHRLLPQLSVLENVQLPALAGFDNDQNVIEQRATELLTRVGLQSRLHSRPATLSGGERQRVAVCRGLVMQPSLLLADEPTGNLDPQTAETIGKLLLEVAAENDAGLLCVTHSDSLAGAFSHQLYLDNGRLAGKQAMV